jgi:hypothetical protein
MTPSDRKKFLNTLLDLEIFDYIEIEYKELLRDNKATITSNQKLINYLNYTEDTKDQILELKKNIDSHNINNDEELLKKYKKELNEIVKKRLHINKKFENIPINKLKKMLSNYDTEKLNINVEQIDKDNNELLRQIKQTSINKFNYNEKYYIQIPNNIKTLKLINNKEIIINNNKLYELNRNNKLIELKSKINPTYKKMNKIIDSKIINNLQNIYDNFKIVTSTDTIAGLKSDLSYIETKYTLIKSKVNDIYNLIDFKIIIDEDIKIKYKTINYKSYIENINIKLSNYELIKQTFIISETYKDIINMFDNFNVNINKQCSNCINHSHNIKQFYCCNNLHLDNVKDQYEYLTKIQNEKEQLYNYHLIKQYEYFKQYLDMLELMICDLTKQIKSYTETNLNIFKDELFQIINKFNNSNLLHQIDSLEQSTNDEYIMLLNELELYNEYNKHLEDYYNYKYNLDIYKKIDENKKLCMDFYDKELINETINNLIHNEENDNKYHTLCQNIEKLTEKINISKNKYLENIKQYNILIEKEKKYIGNLSSKNIFISPEGLIKLSNFEII